MEIALWKALRVAAFAAFGLGVAAHAGDGVIEINQTKALAGNVTPGDTPGFPVLLTQSGSYRLTSSLTVPAGGTGIIVNNFDTTIDLGGFTIEGTYTCCAASGSGSGIQSVVSRIKIASGNITGFGLHGIQLGGFSHVEGVLVRQVGGNGIELGSGGVALANRVDQVGEGGIRFTGNLPGLYRDNVLTRTARNAGSTARAIDGLAHASGGNVCDDASCSRRGARRYYLTTTVSTADLVNLTPPCDPGFHFASIHELRDVTTLEYDARRGPASLFVVDSSVGGPSSASTGWGWIRTGYAHALFGDLFEPGDSNCVGYSFGSGAAPSRGVRAKPTETWNTPPLAAGAWEVEVVGCDTTNRAWCVED